MCAHQPALTQVLHSLTATHADALKD